MSTHADIGNFTGTSGGGNYPKCGWKITVGATAMSLISVEREADSTATKAYVYNSAKDTQIGTTATFGVDDVATFGSAITLNANTTYYIGIDSEGGSYVHRYKVVTGTIPYDFTDFSLIKVVDNSAGAWGADNVDYLFGVRGITYDLASASTNMTVNVGDANKEVAELSINVGDTWKAVNSASVNIGDTWKTIF